MRGLTDAIIVVAGLMLVFVLVIFGIAVAIGALLGLVLSP